MSVYEEKHYKECHPNKTVEKLKKILDSCNVEVEETEPIKSSINTVSLRVSIKGTDIGTNGKGVNIDYARASAYAEFFERFQNSILGHTIPLENLPYIVSNDEITLSTEEIVTDNNSYINYYFKERNLSNGTISEKISHYEEVIRFDPGCPESKYIALPFYSVRDHRVVYLPYASYSAMYGSNGMCAGNTYEEAIVQGLSEIVERVVQRKIFLEKPCFPDIPIEFIKKYENIYDMFLKASSNKKYSIMLKDCSFGGKYPVVALCIIEKNTGRYGIKLGCHPNLRIAMERTFTEITQGIDIFEFSRSRSWLDFSNKDVDTADNIANSFKVGMSQYPYQFFGKSPDYRFTAYKDVSNLSNAEILKDWLYDFIPEYDVLIRDVSFTGFPSFHIIIPGLSEMHKLTDSDYRVRNTRTYVSYLLGHTEEITLENVKYIIAVLKSFSNSIYENTISSYLPPDCKLNVPFAGLGSDVYLLAMCYAFKKDYLSAKKYIEILCRRAKSELLNISQESIDLINGIYHYFSAMCEMNSHKKAMEYLELFFDSDLSDNINYWFEDPNKIISRQYRELVVDRLPFFNDFRYKIAEKYSKEVINQADLSKIL